MIIFEKKYNLTEKYLAFYTCLEHIFLQTNPIIRLFSYGDVKAHITINK